MHYLEGGSGTGVPESASEFLLVGAIAHWCEGLQGQVPIMNALRPLAEGLGADAINLARASRTSVGESRSLIHDSSAISSQSPKLDRSYARAVLGPYFEHPKTGTIWLTSMVESSGDPELEVFQSRRHLAELAVVPLEVTSKSIDFLELHFRAKLDWDRHAALNMIAETLSRTWCNRKPGLLTESTLQRSRPDRSEVKSANLLSCENPAKLSRAEFRVCLLLSRGLASKAVCNELHISKSTLRTHLRNIYTKTDSSGQAELLFRLLQPASQVPLPSIRIA